jgi:hypothetical protein
MSDTAVPTATNANQSAPSNSAPETLIKPAELAAGAPEKKPQTMTGGKLLMSCMKFLASLQLTVFLFVVSLILVFVGTIAQIDNGIWTVMDKYFRSFVVWVPWQLFVQFGYVFFGVDRSVQVSGSFPFPGGLTVGLALMINLVAAHLVRFKTSWKRSGIITLHAGVILLLIGEAIARFYSVEATMSIAVGETVRFTDVTRVMELAITSPNKDDERKEDVITIPERYLTQPGMIDDPQLPFKVEVLQYWKNSNLSEGVKRKPDYPIVFKGLDNLFYVVTKAEEESGVDTAAREDYPAVEVKLIDRESDKVLAQIFTTLWFYPNRTRRQLEFDPQEVKHGNTTYTVELRPKREHKPFQMTLKEFRHDLYPGTNTPKNFSSLVDLRGDAGANREAKIYMNNPLFQGGETYYQSGYFPKNDGTILQVVRNPGWLMPYLACTLVTLGMLIHFCITLNTFLLQRRAQA